MKNCLIINVSAFFKTIYNETISYSTVREATVKNIPVAIVYRLVQLIILAYIIGYSIYNKIFYFISKFNFIVTIFYGIRAIKLVITFYQQLQQKLKGLALLV